MRRALYGAKDFGEFREKRAFSFLHFFSGPNDVLGKAVYQAAVKEGLTVDVTVVDFKMGGADLLKDKPNVGILEDAQRSEWDAVDGGPPCKIFSRARWNWKGPGPAPVRSWLEIYGLSSNSTGQQKQADDGTLLAARTVMVVGETLQLQRRRRVPEVGTLANPPGSEETDLCGSSPPKGVAAAFVHCRPELWGKD